MPIQLSLSLNQGSSQPSLVTPPTIVTQGKTLPYVKSKSFVEPPLVVQVFFLAKLNLGCQKTYN